MVLFSSARNFSAIQKPKERGGDVSVVSHWPSSTFAWYDESMMFTCMFELRLFMPVQVYGHACMCCLPLYAFYES